MHSIRKNNNNNNEWKGKLKKSTTNKRPNERQNNNEINSVNFVIILLFSFPYFTTAEQRLLLNDVQSFQLNIESIEYRMKKRLNNIESYKKTIKLLKKRKILVV